MIDDSDGTLRESPVTSSQHTNLPRIKLQTKHLVAKQRRVNWRVGPWFVWGPGRTGPPWR